MRYVCGSIALVATVGLTAAAPAAGQEGAIVSPTGIRVSFPLGRRVESTWKWYETATPDNEAEYRWFVRIGDRYTFGFSLFKLPGWAPQTGSFEELLQAGQADVWSLEGKTARQVRGVKPQLRAKADSLIVELTHPALVAGLIQSNAREIVVESHSPYRTRTAKVVPMQFDSAAQRVSIEVVRVDSIARRVRSLADSAGALVDTLVVSPPALRLAAGDSIPLFPAIQIEGRDAAGRVIMGLMPLLSAAPTNLVRMRNGHLVAIAPGEAELLVRLSGSQGDSARRESGPATRVKIVVDPRQIR